MPNSEFEKYLLSKNGAFKDFPFGEDTAVFKVGKKMFALISLKKNPLSINLKCDPEEAFFLRSAYESVIPGYHMNKDHWNSVILDGSVPLVVIHEMIDKSYDLVFKTLKKAEKEELLKR